ncbi:ABC transporter permease [Marinicrinis lubricantis]|uniref:Transport permease protein n=1 Tax=Marinicrinis lubricantis TaxID=2086470 RepID=A0ABW1IV62_9BACL
MTIIMRTMLVGMLRESHTVILTILFPVAMLIGLGLYFDNPDYSERLVVGVLALNVLFGASMVTAFHVMAHRNRGIYKLLRVTPFSTAAFICSMTCARAVLTLLVSCCVLLTGAFVFNVTVSLTSIALLLFILLVGTICFTAIGFIAANLSKDESNVNMISNLICFPMLFTSEAFYSMKNAPDGLQAFAHMQPFYYLVKAMSAAVSSHGSPLDLWSPATALAGFAGLCLILASVTFRWDPVESPARGTRRFIGKLH